MLCDKLIAATYVENLASSSLLQLHMQLQQAQKFDLSSDAVAAAEEMMSSYDRIAHTIEHIRLPFPNLWMEVAHQHRARFLRAPMHLPSMQSVPKRVGFLLSEVTPKRFAVHLFWEHLNGNLNMSNRATYYDLGRAASAAPVPLENSINKYKFFSTPSAEEWVRASDITRGQLTAIAIPGEPVFKTSLPEFVTQQQAELLFEIAAADWSGETVFILSVLALLNTVNAVITERVDCSRLNKARAKHKKHPLANHYVLKIHPRIKRYIKREDDPKNPHKYLRGHFVRGHWKVRKTGIYFWHSHIRGDEKNPITKTYEVD